MKELMSVLGILEPKQLGFCQFHEHILLSRGVSYTVNPDLCMDDVNKSLKEVLLYKKAGGCSFIDAQPGGCNRMTMELVQLSGQSGVHIIASAGFHKLCFYPEGHFLYTASENELADIFITELTKGMYTDIDHGFHENICGYKAGILKTALNKEGLSPVYVKLFKAAVRAALETNKVIMVHIEAGADPVKLFDFLIREGAEAANLVFCHMDRACPDLSVHKKLLSEGIYFEFDTIGRFKYHSDEYEASIFKELTDAGFGKQLLFSLDTTRARLKSYESNAVGLDYILKSFVNTLERAGLTKEQIHLFSHENCIRALTG